MLSYEFMQKAFIVGIALSLIMPLIGMVIVLRRLSMVGDSLSHSSLAGITAGLAFGFNPIVGAVASTLLAAFGIEAVRKRMPRYSDMAIAIITSAGLGLTGILTSFVKDSTSFNSFLFGSIVTITTFELGLVLALALVVFLSLWFLSRELFIISLDPRSAIISGIPVGLVNTVFTILIALTIAIASRTVGALIVSSIMVIPVASAMQIASSYKKTRTLALVLAVFSTIVGLSISFYLGLKPGASIVMVEVLILIISLVYKGLKKDDN